MTYTHIPAKSGGVQHERYLAIKRTSQSIPIAKSLKNSYSYPVYYNNVLYHIEIGQGNSTYKTSNVKSWTVLMLMKPAPDWNPR